MKIQKQHYYIKKKLNIKNKTKVLFKESMFKDLKDLKNIKQTPKSKNIKIITKEPVKITKKKVKKNKTKK